MSKGFKFSIILHLTIIFLCLFSFSFLHEKKYAQTIAIDIVKIEKQTNLPNRSIASEKTSEQFQSKKVEKKFVESAKQKSLQKNEVKPTKKTEQNIKKTKKTLPKKNDKPSKKTGGKSSKSELDTFLKSLEKESIESKKGKYLKKVTEENKGTEGKSTKKYDESMALTIDQIDYIQNKIASKFNNPIVYEFQPGEIIIEIKLTMKIDGEIENVEVLDSSKYPAKYVREFDTLKNNLIRACYKASPIENLPKDKFSGINGWQEIIVSFDASNLMKTS
jgi:outer membrane biosynthesis protein TonB